MKIDTIIDSLIRDLRTLTFGPPVSRVYNPLEYARVSHDRYFHLYGKQPREILLVGMNPGPWGMAQTGVPFGEVAAVKEWLGIDAEVGTPRNMHPKRPVDGFACSKSEVSGRRLWGWAKEHFGSPTQFFSRFFVINYCPLIFLEESGRNRTPDKLPKSEKESLFQACDRALYETVQYFEPRCVIGVGRFAEKRITAVLKNTDLLVGRITHPSPANPQANKGWSNRVESDLRELGIPGF
ncbi:MAG: single-stranded DNA-binding protein [Proteobacteria bacterium]|nr:single-stranded DNA-binding protein [Pseudomonadota bacterium]